MPEVSRFYGVIIRMYFDEHDPPHFHAILSDAEAQIGIDPIRLLRGDLPHRLSRWSSSGRLCINAN